MNVVCFDLDDTLYKEIDYVKSAYQDIAQYAVTQCKECSDNTSILCIKAYEMMLTAHFERKNAFEVLNAFLGLNFPISDYLYIYRNHKPKIALIENIKQTLNTLQMHGTRIGIITDGRSVQQRNKIEALELGRWVDDKDIVISEEFSSEKPSIENFVYFMKRYPKVRCTYVGDNPMKDFMGANILGWDTVCLLDDGNNIHKQAFEKYGKEFQPKYKIRTLTELINLI